MLSASTNRTRGHPSDMTPPAVPEPDWCNWFNARPIGSALFNPSRDVVRRRAARPDWKPGPRLLPAAPRPCPGRVARRAAPRADTHVFKPRISYSEVLPRCAAWAVCLHALSSFQRTADQPPALHCFRGFGPEGQRRRSQPSLLPGLPADRRLGNLARLLDVPGSVNCLAPSSATPPTRGCPTVPDPYPTVPQP
jgi:hypothetical protein